MNTGQEPAPPVRGGGVLEGGDTGQSAPATARDVLVQPPVRVVGTAPGAAGDDDEHPVGS